MLTSCVPTFVPSGFWRRWIRASILTTSRKDRGS
jgi:hypothetical protein